jgi:hypothetical protein
MSIAPHVLRTISEFTDISDLSVGKGRAFEVSVWLAALG